MSRQIDCNETNRASLVERYLLGGMRKKERRAFEQHLEACHDCSQQLRESRKIVTTLKNAAEKAGWTENQVAQLDRLYSRGSLLQNINWRLAAKIAVVVLGVFIVPFLWWANKAETKMALLVNLQRETRLLTGETDHTGNLQKILALHKEGKDEMVIAALDSSLSTLDETIEKATAERLLGLSYLFNEQPDSALNHLQHALRTQAPDAEQLSYLYIAKAHLLMGNRLGAISALKKAAGLRAIFTAEAAQLIEKLEQLERKK
jgi:tetratricopeptide (TPR) repeat protein